MGRAIPIPSADTRPFWDGAARGELRLPQCEKCDTLLYPPPPRCPRCLNKHLRWERLSGKGTLWSWTEIFVNAIPELAPPIAICEIALAEQHDLLVLASCNVPELARLSIGSSVQIYFADEGNGAHIPYVHSLLEAPADDLLGSPPRGHLHRG